MTGSMSINMSTNDPILFLFMAESHSIVYMNHIFIRSFVDGHLICLAEIETPTENKCMGIPTGKGLGGKNWEIGIDIYTLLILSLK